MFDTLNLKQDEFKVWLTAQRNDVVGYRGELQNCPIANYVKSLSKTPQEVLVAPNGINIDGVQYNVPHWVTQYETRIDNCTKEFIMKDHALRILREI